MINEHISKSSFPSESCPKGKEYCEYGFQTCVYTRQRFGIERCNSYYPYVKEKIHALEVQSRSNLNIPSWDYKPQLDQRSNINE